MQVKRLCITALVGLNVVLAVLLLASTIQPPTAAAQRPGARGGGQFLAVTAEYTAGTDALYMLDAATGELVVLVPERNGSGKLMVADKRDTNQDL